jgi:dihydroorotate dehydrogenase (NAD+) catalytic subunit
MCEPMGLLLTSGKRDLMIDPPRTNSAGILGFSDEARHLVDLSRLGAFVTNPVSLAPRTFARTTHFKPYPGGFLLHTGHPHPGLREVVRAHRKRWANLPVPVIVHLLAQEVSQVGRMTEVLESVEEVSAIELGLIQEDTQEVSALVAEAVLGELPVVACVPLNASRHVAIAAVGAGANALVIGPPRGALPGLNGVILRGRLYGPGLFPLALKALQELVPVVVCPILVGCGVYSPDQASALIDAGATGVQFDSILWTGPERVLGFVDEAT